MDRRFIVYLGEQKSKCLVVPAHLSFDLDAHLVSLISVLEILHMVLLAHGVYATLAAGYANPAVLLVCPFSFAALPFINGFSACCMVPYE